ncbi:P-loop containing nucleoside triphosphate hydrolase protein [Multifurca ochricompacta]|uniref:RNA helicase n=1 Tax=Multifurca ochricompacta TaxID=376703 RepID=A0AAD4M7U9_9AGAM|nr:P-loop containing nucleoside triphosphate hydrolase protein [Multifurca ochricompacta]
MLTVPLSSRPPHTTTQPETNFQECHSSRRPATVMLDSEEEYENEDELHSLNSKPPIHGQKRQRFGESQLTGTQDKKVSTANRDSKDFRCLQEQREQLPIARGRESLMRSIALHDVTIILGETGSGKTTQVPQYLLEEGSYHGQIAVTQPRRVAATSLATRVSAEQGQPLGTLVGYSVRFDERVSPGTRIKYLTDGMLIREMMNDSLLTRYGIVIVDEAHERTLRTDIVLASLKQILARRNGRRDERTAKGKGKANPLKVIVMSATMDAEKFSNFFEKAPVLYVKGRQHPVSIFHTSTSQNDYLDAALRTFFQIHVDRPPGDVLVFLPGQDDIESLESSLRLYASQLPHGVSDVVICPLYASLPNAQQAKVFLPTPPSSRKCILATNIAETSITIPGVRYVIDTGKQKEKRHFARIAGSGFDTLLTTDITKSSAVQRSGRAGRDGHGYCFRLYTEDAFNSMAVSAEPEVQRSSLTSAFLQLKVIGQDLDAMPFMDRPDQESVGSALRTLWLLDAIDNSRHLTDFGRSLAMFPLEPQYAAILLASVNHSCTSEVISILALLSSSAPLFTDSSSQRDAANEARAKFRHPSGDHWAMLNVFRAYDEVRVTEGKSGYKGWCKRNFVNQRALREAGDIRTQLRGICDGMGIDCNLSCGNEEVPVLRSLLRGLLQQVAFLQPDGSYKQVMGPSVVKIHPSSFLADKRSPAIIYNELVYTTNIYARGVSAVYKSFISEFPKLTGIRVS